jgi:hypothetical protein
MVRPSPLKCRSTPSWGPTTRFSDRLPPLFPPPTDPTTDTVTVDDGTGAVVLPNATIIPRDPFRQYWKSGTGTAVRAETVSGSGTVLIWLGMGRSGTVLSRLSDTELPRSGSAEFAGSYFGSLVDESGGTRYFGIEGDVALAADFAAATISGAVTGRSVLGTAAAPLVLGQTGIVDGAFAGAATGGELGRSVIFSFMPGTTTAPGSHSGLFTGATGQEIVGGVVIPHDEAGRALTEVGAFVTERTGP